MKKLLFCGLLLLSGSGLAHASYLCRGLMITPDPEAARLSDDHVLWVAKQYFDLSIVPLAADEVSPIQRVILLAPKRWSPHRRKNQRVLNELLATYPLVLLGYQVDFAVFDRGLRQWRAKEELTDPKIQECFSYFDLARTPMAQAVSQHVARFRNPKIKAQRLSTVNASPTKPILPVSRRYQNLKTMVGGSLSLCGVAAGALMVTLPLAQGLPLYYIPGGFTILAASSILAWASFEWDQATGRMRKEDLKAMLERIAELRRSQIESEQPQFSSLLVITDSRVLKRELQNALLLGAKSQKSEP